jgi:hypothetical protein
MSIKSWSAIPAVLGAFAICSLMSDAQDQSLKVTVYWEKVIRTSQTTPTLQVVVNPPLQRGTQVHDNAFKSLYDLVRTTSAMYLGSPIRSWGLLNWSPRRMEKHPGISPRSIR